MHWLDKTFIITKSKRIKRLTGEAPSLGLLTAVVSTSVLIQTLFGNCLGRSSRLPKPLTAAAASVKRFEGRLMLLLPRSPASATPNGSPIDNGPSLRPDPKAEAPRPAPMRSNPTKGPWLAESCLAELASKSLLLMLLLTTPRSRTKMFC